MDEVRLTSRTMTEMVKYFINEVAQMDIDRKHKMALLGMMTAIEYKYDVDMAAGKPRQWIRESERAPETEEFVLVSLNGKYENATFEHAQSIGSYDKHCKEWLVEGYPDMTAQETNRLIEAWMPLPEDYKGE